MAILELPYSQVFDLLHHSCTTISPDALFLMKEAALRETNAEAKTFLETMLKNVELASQLDKPVCQSPGFPSVWIRWGEAIQPDLSNLTDNITKLSSKQRKKVTFVLLLFIRLLALIPEILPDRAFPTTNFVIRRIFLTVKS